MKTYDFELTYTDQNGQMKRKIVSGFDTAKALAKELAMASCRRAVIRRCPPSNWRVYCVHRDGTVDAAWNNLTKREVLDRWKLWRERKTGCVLVAWPDWIDTTIAIIATELAAPACDPAKPGQSSTAIGGGKHEHDCAFRSPTE